MAEDYLTDDEQWEAVKRWIAENGLWAVAGVVVGLAVLFGYRYVESSRDDRALRAAAQFDDMTTALQRGDTPKTRRIADGLIKGYPSSPYADQAQLVISRLFVDAGQLTSAVPPLTAVMNDSKDTELRHIARLRLARVSIDQGKPDEAISLLAADGAGAFAGRYHAVRGDAFYAKKDFNGAVTEYKAALGSADAGSVDSAVLDLKLADLGELRAPDPSNKAKP